MVVMPTSYWKLALFEMKQDLRTRSSQCYSCDSWDGTR